MKVYVEISAWITVNRIKPRRTWEYIIENFEITRKKNGKKKREEKYCGFGETEKVHLFPWRLVEILDTQGQVAIEQRYLPGPSVVFSVREPRTYDARDTRAKDVWRDKLRILLPPLPPSISLSLSLSLSLFLDAPQRETASWCDKVFTRKTERATIESRHVAFGARNSEMPSVICVLSLRCNALFTAFLDLLRRVAQRTIRRIWIYLYNSRPDMTGPSNTRTYLFESRDILGIVLAI